MTMKIYTLEEDGKFIEMLKLEANKEESAKKHMSVYHFPEIPYTRIPPIKERAGYDRYFINGKWEYREVLPEPEEESNESEN